MIESTDSYFCEVYEDLHRIAAQHMATERLDHTLSATALVHEVFLRLSSGKRPGWESIGHFFAAASRNMRQVLIDKARSRDTLKRSYTREQVELESVCNRVQDEWAWLLDFEEDLHMLALEDRDAAELVSLRVFSGLSVLEAGRILGLSNWSAYKLWDFARSWFASRAEDHQSVQMDPADNALSSAAD